MSTTREKLQLSCGCKQNFWLSPVNSLSRVLLDFTLFEYCIRAFCSWHDIYHILPLTILAPTKKKKRQLVAAGMVELKNFAILLQYHHKNCDGTVYCKSKNYYFILPTTFAWSHIPSPLTHFLSHFRIYYFII